eukprot:1163291-Prorocentrum_minimum.AAC.1
MRSTNLFTTRVSGFCYFFRARLLESASPLNSRWAGGGRGTYESLDKSTFAAGVVFSLLTICTSGTTAPAFAIQRAVRRCGDRTTPPGISRKPPGGGKLRHARGQASWYYRVTGLGRLPIRKMTTDKQLKVTARPFNKRQVSPGGRASHPTR